MPIDVLTTLWQMHDYDVVHGDIKLANIVYYSNTNRYQLIDFGSVMRVEDNEWVDTDSYTSGYQSPEGGKSKSTNIYAFGMTYLKWLLDDGRADLNWLNLITDSICLQVLKGCLTEKPENRMLASDLLNIFGINTISDYISKIDSLFVKALNIRKSEYPDKLYNNNITKKLISLVLDTMVDEHDASTILDVLGIITLYSLSTPIELI